MHLAEVKTQQEKREFINLPKRLYKDDPSWICPLNNSIENLFNPEKNHSFRRGEAARWILVNDSGEVLGRVAAFTDKQRSDTCSQPTGGMGFFEVIENREAAFMLFDKAKEWLSARGMEAIDAPVNFGENDTNWGLLVDGFMPQAYGMPYNKSYYKQYFEEYGFRNYFEQYSFHREVRRPDGSITNFPERVMKIAEWLTKRPGYTFRSFTFKESRKFFEDICEIYNTTWTWLKKDFTPLEPDILEETMNKAKPIIDEDLIWFAYYNGKPVGFFVLLPDFNQILRHIKGRLDLLSLLKVLYYKQKHEMTRMRAIVGGVHHSHQNSGIESAIFYQLYQVFKRKPWYKELELSWVGDYNPKMLAVYKALGAERAKTHVTYRYMINTELEFKRYIDEA
jgi:hypothetical protein